MTARTTMAGVIAGALFLAACASATAAERYRTFVAERFGARADVPVSWKIQPPPTNNDGRRFISPDGSGEITVSGSFHVLDSIKEEMDMRASPDGATVTYVKRDKRSIVVSGLRGDRIFYDRAMLVCRDQVWVGVHVEYPASEKANYDALVKRVAGSLRGGPGYNADCR